MASNAGATYLEFYEQSRYTCGACADEGREDRFVLFCGVNCFATHLWRVHYIPFLVYWKTWIAPGGAN
jgi:hypothetical protein